MKNNKSQLLPLSTPGLYKIILVFFTILAKLKGLLLIFIMDFFHCKRNIELKT